MKRTTDNPIPLLLAASLLLAGPGALRAADATVEYRAQPTNTTVEIQGTSTFHDWEMKGTSIGGFLDFPAGTVFDLSQTSLPSLKDGNLPASGTASIAVGTIHSQVAVMPGVMDGVMQDYMKATNFPRILYHVTALKLKTPHVAGQPFAFDATGDLTIAGVTNKVAFPVTIEPLDKDKIIVRGAAQLKMSDYKVPPPAPNIAGLGIMKCGDDIKVLFNWTLMIVPPKQP
jgi:polyisoprenoid-binding protein YceI